MSEGLKSFVVVVVSNICQSHCGCDTNPSVLRGASIRVQSFLGVHVIRCVCEGRRNSCLRLEHRSAPRRQCWMVEMIIVAAYRAHPPRSTQYHKTIIVAGVHEQFIQNDAIQVLVL